MIKTSVTGLLAFLQTGDIYDPDRVEADRELLRRFYLKHGYIDVRVVSAVGEYDPTLRGFVITFTIEEGDQYRIGTVDVQSSIRSLDPSRLRWRLRTYPGDVYNAGFTVVPDVQTFTNSTSTAIRDNGTTTSTIPRRSRSHEAPPCVAASSAAWSVER